MMISLTSRYIQYKLLPFFFLLSFCSAQILFPKTSCSYQLSPVSVNIISNNEISVAGSLGVDSKFAEDLNDGMSKELVFYIDLFRIWKVWPDEFITGKKITRTLKSDPIKREYVAVSIEGNTTVEKRFKDIESMLSWSLSFKDARIYSIRDFEAGKYFVKVTVESAKKKLPPIIGYFLFFVSEKEFSTSRDSLLFQLPREPAK